MPHFTYHGFRYAEVELQGNIELLDIHCCVAYTDLPGRGDFACSNDLLNEVQKCCRNSLLTNYHGIPTDCPHREKNGWTGDAMFSSDALLYNFDPTVVYEKWMDDFSMFRSLAANCRASSRLRAGALHQAAAQHGIAL